MTAWEVWVLAGDWRKDRLLTTVYFDDDCNYDYVRRSLIEHDNYPSNISLAQPRKLKC